MREKEYFAEDKEPDNEDRVRGKEREERIIRELERA